jgi:hypothetical protein
MLLASVIVMKGWKKGQLQHCQSHVCKRRVTWQSDLGQHAGEEVLQLRRDGGRGGELQRLGAHDAEQLRDGTRRKLQNAHVPSAAHQDNDDIITNSTKVIVQGALSWPGAFNQSLICPHRDLAGDEGVQAGAQGVHISGAAAAGQITSSQWDSLINGLKAMLHHVTKSMPVPRDTWMICSMDGTRR